MAKHDLEDITLAQRRARLREREAQRRAEEKHIREQQQRSIEAAAERFRIRFGRLLK